MQVLQDAKTCDSHGCEECRFCRTQKPAPKAAAACIFSVGAFGEGFVEAAHEPGKVSQSLPADLQPFCIAEQILFLGTAGEGVDFAMDGCWEKTNPADGHLLVSPRGRQRRVNPQHDVDVIAHHRIGVDADGKDSASSRRRPSTHSRRCSYDFPLYGSTPHNEARRTHREMQW